MSLFQMSVAGGVLILFIVVIRALAIHRLPKTTFLALWMIAALRLLLPFSIPLPFNIHIGLDVFSDVVQEYPPEISVPPYWGTICRLRNGNIRVMADVISDGGLTPQRWSKTASFFRQKSP